MIETRYRVVNKWLREIRDIDVKESSVKGSSGSFGVTTPLHCKVGEYLNTNLTFHDNTFEKSLHSGLLKTYLQNGDIVQVFYDTVARKEVDSPYGNPQPMEPQPSSQITAMAKMFNDAGITADDLKDLVGLLKEKKAGKTKTKAKKQEETIEPIESNQQPVNNSNTVVDNSVEIQQKETQKSIENSTQSTQSEQPVDNSEMPVNNYSLSQEQDKFKAMGYQQKLKYIKEQCNNTEMLKWIQANFKQVAIFNSASKKIQTLESPKTEI